MLLHNLASVGQSFAIVHWLMGIWIRWTQARWAGWRRCWAPLSGICLMARQWNLMAVGEEWAATRGASPHRLLADRLRWLDHCSPPSLQPSPDQSDLSGLWCRTRCGSGWAAIIDCCCPASFLLGASFLAMCDTLARTMLLPAEIPVGVITALLGGPFFIYLLRGSREERTWLWFEDSSVPCEMLTVVPVARFPHGHARRKRGILPAGQRVCSVCAARDCSRRSHGLCRPEPRHLGWYCSGCS